MMRLFGNMIKALSRRTVPIVGFIMTVSIFVLLSKRNHIQQAARMDLSQIWALDRMAGMEDVNCTEVLASPASREVEAPPKSPEVAHSEPEVVQPEPKSLVKEDIRLKEATNIGLATANCKFQRSIFYLKIHKTASSTINTILDRVVMMHELKQVPVIDNPWPRNELVQFVMKKPNGSQELGTYNVFSDHYIYNEKSVNRVMAPDAVYVASIRFPLTQLRSVFDEFFLAKSFGITSADPVETFLKNLDKYGNRNIYTHNLHAVTFGMDKSKFNDKNAIKNLLSFIDQKYTLVMVTEYFTESLVLLRRKMCWEMADMVYLAQRVNTQSKHKYKILDWSLEEAHRKYSYADYAIYEYFTAKLFREIQKELHFWKEVDTLKRINKRLEEFCQPTLVRLKQNIQEIYRIEKENKSITFNPFPWGKPFTIFSVECAIMKLDTVILRNNIKIRQSPELCTSPRINRRFNGNTLYFNVAWDKKSSQNTVVLHKKYCDPMHPRFKIPMSILADKSAYMWLNRV